MRPDARQDIGLQDVAMVSIGQQEARRDIGAQIVLRIFNNPLCGANPCALNHSNFSPIHTSVLEGSAEFEQSEAQLWGYGEGGGGSMKMNIARQGLPLIWPDFDILDDPLSFFLRLGRT